MLLYLKKKRSFPAASMELTMVAASVQTTFVSFERKQHHHNLLHRYIIQIDSIGKRRRIINYVPLNSSLSWRRDYH
jgi:hypothetical protein